MDGPRDQKQQQREQRIRGGWTPGGPQPAGWQGDPDLLPAAGETLDRLSGNWCLFQLRRGHRYSTDDLLTAWYGCRGAELDGLCVRRILDLGCGIGSVGMMAAWRFPQARLVGIEAQPVSVALARRSLRFNGITGRAEVRQGDLRDPALLPEGPAFELVLASPPYLPPGTGSVSEKPQCEPCRFETRGGVEGYCAAAARGLAPDGVLSLVFAWRDAERVRAAARQAGLAVRRLRPVVTREGQPPLLGLFLLGRDPDGGNCGAAELEPPLLVRQADGRRSPEMQALREQMGFPPERASSGSR